MKLTVETHIDAAPKKAWDAWSDPKAIVHWNAASDDWHTTSSEVDLRVGGHINSRMEAKDGSMGFDFAAMYTRIEPGRLVESRLEDGRMVLVEFVAQDGGVLVRETFDAEEHMDLEMQRQGWQAILDNFGRYVAAND